MKTWGITLIVLALLTAICGCSISALDGDLALAPGAGAPDSGDRAASALSWGSPIVLDSTTPSGNDGISLAMIAGNPAVSYQIWSDAGPTAGFTVYYVRANDSAGTSWGDSVAVTFWPMRQDYNCSSSLYEVNGKPAIAYQSFPNGMAYCDVRFVRAKDTVGNNWGNPVIIAPDDQEGLDFQGDGTTLRVVNGNPAVWYKDAGNQRYVRALDAKGSNWGSPQIIGPAGAMSIVNGYPALRCSSGGALYFRRAADAYGDSWCDPVVFGYGSNISSLAYVNSNPAVAFCDDLGALCFVCATDLYGDSWGSPQTVLTDAGPADFIKLEVVDGCPAIAFSGKWQTSPDSSVRFIKAQNSGGTTWPSAAVDVTISGDESVERLLELAIINGSPSIFFYNVINSAAPGDPPAYGTAYLNFIQALDPVGSAWETPETVVDYGTRIWIATAMNISESGAMVVYPDRALWNAVNFIASTGPPPPPPDPAVDVQLSTDKSAYIIGEDVTAVLTAVVTDEYGDPISGLAGSFVTTLDGGSVSPGFSEGSAGTYTGSVSLDGLLAGDHTVQTVVTDSRGIEGSGSAMFSMNEPGAGGTMHVGDLDANIVLANKNRWCAEFTVKIVDSNGNPVNGADVSFSLSGNDSGSGQVTTGSDGTASYQAAWINGSGSVTFTVTDVTHATLTYSPGDNDDPDGDSDGTSITATGP